MQARRLSLYLINAQGLTSGKFLELSMMMSGDEGSC
jgi:hypothetical protein